MMASGPAVDKKGGLSRVISGFCLPTIASRFGVARQGTKYAPGNDTQCSIMGARACDSFITLDRDYQYLFSRDGTDSFYPGTTTIARAVRFVYSTLKSKSLIEASDS
jgi:hypothetical protein